MEVLFKDGRVIKGMCDGFVYYERNGKNYMRKAPGERKYETSTKQKSSEHKLVGATMFYRLVIKPNQLLSKIWKIAAKDKPYTGYNYFIGKNYGVFNVEEEITDYSLLQFIDGKIKLPPYIAGKVISGDGFEISWASLEEDYSGNEDDKFYVIMMYKDYTFRTLILDNLNVRRKDASCVINMPEGKEKMCNVWCFFVSQDESNFSPSKHFELDWNSFSS